MTPREAARALLRDRLVAAEQVIARDAAVLEHVGRGVVGADAELLLLVRDDEAGRALLDQERLDAGAPGRRVDRRPHHHALGAAAGGDEDLLAVEHPVVAVERRGGAHQRRIGAAARLGDRHRERSGRPTSRFCSGVPAACSAELPRPRFAAAHAHRVVAPRLAHGDQHAQHRHAGVVRRCARRCGS